MAITQDDIKLRKPERLTDFDDGGGAMTADEVISGQLNNIYPDVSRLDKTYGRVSLRKVFMAVATPTTDTLYGAHAIITDPPDDPDIEVTIFQTGVYADQRDDARNRVESYVAPSIESRFVLYGQQLAGQQSLAVYCEADVGSPDVGQVLCLRQFSAANTETATLLREQFVRVQRVVSRQLQDFVEPGTGANPVKFVKAVLNLELSSALRFNFTGTQPTLSSNSPASAKVNLTSAVNAATYYGVKKLSANAAAGSLTISVPSLFAQLVPSAQTEVPLVDERAGGDAVQLLAAAAAEVPFPLGTATLQTLPTAITPGTCRVSGASSTYDDGNGNLTGGGGNTLKIDYANGRVQYSSGSNALPDFRYVPAAAVTKAAFTGSYPVTATTQSFNFVLTLQPRPAPGSFFADFKSQGRWYRLRDNGAGNLRGDDPSFGSGTINYTTGSVVVTCGALPDVNTQLLYGWCGTTEYTVRSAVALSRHAIEFSLPDENVAPATLALTVPTDGAPRIANAGNSGAITGTGITGFFNAQAGKGYIVLDFYPPANSVIQAAYNKNSASTGQLFENLTPDVNNDVAITLGAAQLQPGSVQITFEATSPYETHYQSYFGVQTNLGGTQTRREIYTDDGAGVLRDAKNTVVGSINYTTRVATFKARFQETRPPVNVQQVYFQLNGALPGNLVRYGAPITGVRTYTATAVQAAWAPQSSSSSASTAQIPVGAITLDLSPQTTEAVVPGSVMFDMGGKRFYDSVGAVYRDFDTSTGAGLLAGSIEYSTGKVTLTSYGAGLTAAAPVLRSLLTNASLPLAANVVRFRTSGSPLRAASAVLQATLLDGGAVVVTSDAAGVMTGTNANGRIDFENGIVQVQFGQELDDNDNAADLTHRTQGWYSSTARYNVGTVAAPNWRALRPTPVDPSSVRYSAVSFAALPLDAQLIGVDAVRLPLDGRVPVFKKGYVLVVHDTAIETLPNNLTSSQVISLPRSGLAYATLTDQNGAAVPLDRYSVNLTTGQITMAAALNLAGFVQPLRAEHRIEDMVLCTEAQISGQLSLSRALSKNYTAANSYVSSALLFGDMQARQTNLFDQQTWTGVWQDTPVGSNAAASYNALAFPIAVRNADAITERWAIVFTSQTAYNIVGELTGVVGTGTTSSNAAPINPLTGQPYFTMPAGGFGAGWAAGNAIRFNTIGAVAPIWTARTTKPGPLTTPADSVRLQLRGDAN